MKEPGHAKAFSLTTRTRHDAAAAALSSVKAPVLVIMGELDPDFPKPAVEANWIAEQVGGSVLMVAEAGHYPQAQRPELVVPAIEVFAKELHRDAYSEGQKGCPPFRFPPWIGRSVRSAPFLSPVHLWLGIAVRR